MKIKLLNILTFLILIFSLVSCGKIEEDPDDSDIVINAPDKHPNSDTPPVIITPTEGVEYTVSLIYNKRIYVPKENEIITGIITRKDERNIGFCY